MNQIYLIAGIAVLILLIIAYNYLFPSCTFEQPVVIVSGEIYRWNSQLQPAEQSFVYHPTHHDVYELTVKFNDNHTENIIVNQQQFYLYQPGSTAVVVCEVGCVFGNTVNTYIRESKLKV